MGVNHSKSTERLRILLVDDHEIVRRGVRSMIELELGWEVCGEAGDGRTAVLLAAELTPNVVVLDLGMPGLTGLDALRKIRRAAPKTEVLIFTGEENEQMISDLFEAGAHGYILKIDFVGHLIPAIRAMGQHRHYFTDRISEIVFARCLSGKSSAAEDTSKVLTPRERETFQLVAEGNSNKVTAGVLGISTKTVEAHRSEAMRKLGLENFADLMRYAIRRKIVTT